MRRRASSGSPSGSANADEVVETAGTARPDVIGLEFHKASGPKLSLLTQLTEALEGP
jgi:hypothetical protein